MLNLIPKAKMLKLITHTPITQNVSPLLCGQNVLSSGSAADSWRNGLLGRFVFICL